MDTLRKQNLVRTIVDQGLNEFLAEPERDWLLQRIPQAQENITDWALDHFRSRYADHSITKWQIFHYVYAVLHHPLYRERYAANLKRELPRIPFALDFHGFTEIGKQLAEIHVHYEEQSEYPLERIEASGVALNWRVEKMKLSKDKRSLIYNDFLTLGGIPAESFEYAWVTGRRSIG